MCKYVTKNELKEPKKIFIDWVKKVQKELKKELQENADSLEKVTKDIDFGDAKFKLFNEENNNSFLGNVEFKDGENGEMFSINQLINDLLNLKLILIYLLISEVS